MTRLRHFRTVRFAMFSILVFPLFVGFTVALAVGVLTVATRSWHISFTADSVAGPQKFHDAPTPRVGGLAVYAGLWAAAAAAPVGGLLAAVAASALVVLAAGMFEDLTKNTAVALRLAAALLSALIFCLATGHAVTRVDIPFLDRALALPAVAIAFTAVAMAGVSNALNIIDGFNGLATGAAILALAAFAVVALEAGDRDMASFCFAAAGVLAGFLFVNFPSGLVFLGDGGAYLAGFVVAAAGVMVPMRNPEVSPWISLVVLAYPLSETAAAVIRKARKGRKFYRPDGLHLHMLVYRMLKRRLARKAGNGSRSVNPATGALMWTGSAASLAAVALGPHRGAWPIIALALLAGLYILTYRTVARGLLRRRGIGPGGHRPDRRGRLPAVRRRSGRSSTPS